MAANPSSDCNAVTTTTSPPTCDVIIPALNEASNIDALFDSLAPLNQLGVYHHPLHSSADGIHSRKAFILRTIILADNGSTDATSQLAAARGAVVVHEPQRGYGAACLKAIQWISHQSQTQNRLPPDVIVFMDADLSDDPAAIRSLLEPIVLGQADLVIGSRINRADPSALNIVQRFGNGLACWMMRLLTRRRYHDLGPFRAVRWPALQRLHMTDRTWGWTVEMQMKAALLNISTIEVDVPYRRRRSGRSKISGNIRGMIRAGTKIIITIIKLWWRRKAVRTRAVQHL